jgi:hypothetical protein
MEIIFRSFWTFAGTVILLMIVLDFILDVIKEFKKDKK